MATRKLTITNTAAGMRGVFTVAGLRNFAKGETDTVELSDAEADGLASYFTVAGAAAVAADQADDETDDLDTTVAKLNEIAAAEGVDLSAIAGSGPNGRVVKADVQDAIRTARAAAASPGGDDLDEMDDETLRTTVQAITGEEPAADATREQLLAAARGQ